MKLRLLTAILAAVICLSTVPIPSFAAEAVGGGYATESDDSIFSSASSSDESEFITSPGALLNGDNRVVTTDDVDNWVNRKGSEIIQIFTAVVEKASVIGFFMALILIVIGAVGDRRTMTGGFIALIICCLTFTGAACGPQIISSVSAWLKS